jgi:hypothetical protein
MAHPIEVGGAIYVGMAKSKKKDNKLKINLTLRKEQRNKLQQMAALENRSVSNLIGVMADERWERLVDRQGIAYAKTVAETMNLKFDMDDAAGREKLRRALLELVAEKRECQNGVIETVSLHPSKHFGNAIDRKVPREIL